MIFSVYKAEQGYWVRVLTAVCAGVMVLAASAWAWSQAGAVNLPPKAYLLDLQAIDGAFNPGDSIELIGTAQDAVGTEIVIARTGVVGYTETGSRTASLEIGVPELAEGMRVDDAERIRSSSAAAIVRARQLIPVFPLIYLQAGVTGGIMVLGSIAVYWFVASNHRTVDFLINTDGEMRKVNWSSRKEIIGSTQVVIVAAVLIAALLFIVDMSFQQFFQFIGVLES
ncbi:MAG: preprotein translocase subunit SecE [Phycisphaeraceae bacterium]|nr:MAG: preprotein translocase subunit SecE [Phycisphaeraceae bacterium]